MSKEFYDHYEKHTNLVCDILSMLSHVKNWEEEDTRHFMVDEIDKMRKIFISMAIKLNAVK